MDKERGDLSPLYQPHRRARWKCEARSLLAANGTGSINPSMPGPSGLNSVPVYVT